MVYSLYSLFSLLALVISVTSSPIVGQVSGVKRDDVAQPQPQTCTEMSGKIVWTAIAFHLRSTLQLSSPTEVQSGTSLLTFNLSNPAVGYELFCQATSDDITNFFTANQEFSCDSPSDDPSAKASFKFDKPSGTFELSQVWYCNDDMSSRWTASGSTNVTLNCIPTISNKDERMERSGEIYATNNIDCGTIDVPVAPSQMDAVA
ncbi:hypothetical protein QBC44DRAFT_308013 [Cladorrhinum sp. PSN332]|nr:hypothetical protein QBC44DRAFT_308013 [Cladorrhinum sp. PSN332]